MSENGKNRDYLFDNYKALLIIFVIIGHFIQPCYKNNTLLYTMKFFIYSFHMPAFIFISGFFSKRAGTIRKTFQKVLMPYLAFEGIYFLFYNLVLHKDVALDLMRPKFSLWYMLALFVWKVATPYFKKIPHYFLISLAAGLFIGLLPTPSKFLAITRVVVFFPYFLAGTMLDRKFITQLRHTPYKIAGISGIGAFLLFLITMADSVGLDIRIFYGKNSYAKMGQEPIEGILLRMLCYGIGFFLTFAFAALLAEKETLFSRLGRLTMPIYLFHGLCFKLLETTTLFSQIDTIPKSIVLLGFCVILAFALASSPFVTFSNAFANMSLTQLGEYSQRTSPSFLRVKYFL